MFPCSVQIYTHRRPISALPFLHSNIQYTFMGIVPCTSCSYSLCTRQSLDGAIYLFRYQLNVPVSDLPKTTVYSKLTSSRSAMWTSTCVNQTTQEFKKKWNGSKEVSPGLSWQFENNKNRKHGTACSLNVFEWLLEVVLWMSLFIDCFFPPKGLYIFALVYPCKHNRTLFS